MFPNLKETLALSILFLLLTLSGGCEFDNEISSSDYSTLKIVPASVFLDASTTNIVEFNAIGGQQTYVWTLSSNMLGALYFAGTNTATALYYSSTNTGTNILAVSDSVRRRATARIVQR